MQGWIGVDLDGTLARYEGWHGPSHIGAPIPKMAQRVKRWLRAGMDVQIVTARVHPSNPIKAEAEAAIALWTKKVFGVPLPTRADKDYGMVALWDDRCIQIIHNTGERADGVD